jgi:AraC-like DNA-binding protein
MLKKNQCTLYVRNATVQLKEHLDTNSLQYKTCKEILDNTTTVDRKLLEKAFKELYGYGIKQYLLKKRLDLSKQFLQDGLPIKLVATKCLYSSQSTFCKAFKKEFGISPSEWLHQDSQPVPVLLKR